MNDDELKKIANLIDKRMDKALQPIKKQLSFIKERLDDPETGLKRISEQLDANTSSLVKIEQTLGGYKESYQINKFNIERLDTRLTTVEESLSINPPEDLKVPHFSTE